MASASIDVFKVSQFTKMEQVLTSGLSATDLLAIAYFGAIVGCFIGSIASNYVDITSIYPFRLFFRQKFDKKPADRNLGKVFPRKESAQYTNELKEEICYNCIDNIHMGDTIAEFLSDGRNKFSIKQVSNDMLTVPDVKICHSSSGGQVLVDFFKPEYKINSDTVIRNGDNVLICESYFSDNSNHVKDGKINVFSFDSKTAVNFNKFIYGCKRLTCVLAF
jgi:hypothetical protein